jgi:GntR family transcriptional regulator
VLISIDPELRQPIYMQIIDEVRRGRVLGTLRPGDALPSVRQLAADLGINPNTVKQAYRELEREGLVLVRRGHGTFVTDLAMDGAERERMLRSVAERALVQAKRLDAGAEELIEAVRALERSNKREAS